MRPAGRQRSVVIPTTPFKPSSESVSRRTAASLETAAAVEGVDTQLADDADTEVILAPAAFAEAHAMAAALERAERHLRLADDIRQKINKRLSDRVHDLVVRLQENTVVLEGRCATYYTKQLAQQAALSALEDEHLENAIVVTM